MPEDLQCQTWGEHPFLGKVHHTLCQTCCKQLYFIMEFGLLCGHREETGLFWVQLVPQLGQGQLSEPADKNYALEMSL